MKAVEINFLSVASALSGFTVNCGGNFESISESLRVICCACGEDAW